MPALGSTSRKGNIKTVLGRGQRGRGRRSCRTRAGGGHHLLIPWYSAPMPRAHNGSGAPAARRWQRSPARRGLSSPPPSRWPPGSPRPRLN